MKKHIHPGYEPVVFRDNSSDTTYLTRSTLTSDERVELDGVSYPVVDVDISSASHPFWTGRGRVVDTEGRVERFRRRYGMEPEKERADEGTQLAEVPEEPARLPGRTAPRPHLRDQQAEPSPEGASGMKPVRPVPVILVSGIEDEPMAAAAIALQWDLPRAVSVRHAVDPERDVLWRIVSDVTGVVERVEIDVEHACVSCAIREDVVPTLERLGADGRWETIIAQLPVTAEAVQVCRVIGWAPEEVPHVRVAASLVALSRATLLDDLLGGDIMSERDLPVRADDNRGVAEVTCAMVEYADIIAVGDELDDDERELLVALARPGVPVAESFSQVDARPLEMGVHDHPRNESWVAEVRRESLPDRELHAAWVLDFRSDRPFHPQRLREAIALLGGGPRRSRGCFWLPSRPGQICVWDGAGGQLSVGSTETWGRQRPFIRITVVGIDDGRDELERSFASCVLTDAEMRDRGPYWEVAHDGFESWLGHVRRAA